MNGTSTKYGVGALLWLICVQFFVAEIITSFAWPFPYSWSNNYISDLGALHCALAGNGPAAVANPVCSPWHALINLSFIVQAGLIAAGAIMNGAFCHPGL